MMSIAAPRGSGKSFLAAFLLKHCWLDMHDEIIIMCQSIPFNDDYWFLHRHPKVTMIPTFDAGTVEELLRRKEKEKADCKAIERGETLIQESVRNFVRLSKRKRRKRKPLLKKSRFHMDDAKTELRPDLSAFVEQFRTSIGYFTNTIRPEQVVHTQPDLPTPKKCTKTLLILDDCVDSGVLNMHTALDTIAFRGRHVDLSVVVLSQRISRIPVDTRDNSDFFVIFSPYSQSEFESYIDKFISKNKRKEARAKLEQVFETPFQFVLLDNTETVPRRKVKQGSAQTILTDLPVIDLEPVDIVRKRQRQELLGL